MLVTTIDQIIVVVPTLDSEVEFADLESYVESAEAWLKNDILGTALYTTLNADQVANADAVAICRRVISLAAYYEVIPFLDLVHTPTGFGVVSNNNVAPASKDRVAALREQVANRRDKETEALMEYLELTTTYHTEWKASDAYSLAWDLLIPTATIFNKYFDIDKSRRTYVKMMSVIRKIQELHITQAISQDYLDELIEKIKDDDLGTADEAILANLRKAVVFLSLADGIDTLSVVIDQKGIARSYIIGRTSVANESRIMELRSNFNTTGTKYLGIIVNLMNSNLTDYVTYADSDEYAASIAAFTGFVNEETNAICFTGG